MSIGTLQPVTATVPTTPSSVRGAPAQVTGYISQGRLKGYQGALYTGTAALQAPFSKTRRVLACVLPLGFCLSALAQPFSIGWATVDGGGGTSTGGVYAASGTIGQPDAGAMSGGNYTVTGGFWALPAAVQTSGAPTLAVAPAASGFALISWSPNTPGFVLQETPSLSPPAWTNSPSGTTNPATAPATLPTKFYRLHKPGT